jgi:hypothetical protein
MTEPGEGKSYFRFYIVDFTVAKDGQVEYEAPGSLKRSATPWLELETREFTMEPNQKKKVDLTITVPGGVRGGYYSAIVLEELPIPEITSGRHLMQTVRLVTLVELTVDGSGRLRKDAVISGMDVSQGTDKRDLSFIVTVENKGDVHLKAKGDVVIKTKNGSRVDEAPLEAGRGMVLPEYPRDFRSSFRRLLAPGSYVAEAKITFGLRGQAVARLPFSVSAGELAVGALDAERIVQFLVDPYWVDVTAQGGAFRTVPILIANEDQSRIHVSSTARDVSFDIEGRLIVSDASEGPLSCAHWLELRPTEFDLKPRERRRMLVKINVPEDAVGGRCAQVDFEATLLEGEEAPLTSSSGTTLIVTVPESLNVAGRITSVTSSQSAPGEAVDFSVTFVNEGNSHIIPKGKVRVKSLSGASVEPGRPVGEVDLAEIMGVVLPGGTRRLVAAYAGSLQPGRYSAEVTVEYGGESPAKAMREFTVR